MWVRVYVCVFVCVLLYVPLRVCVFVYMCVAKLFSIIGKGRERGRNFGDKV